MQKQTQWVQQPAFRFVTKYEMAEQVGLSPETLKKYRLAGKLIKDIHWIQLNSRVIRYNAALVLDWFQHQHSPQAHQEAIAHYLSTLPSNQPKRGRRAKA